jgi:hypothetical protein
MLPDCDICGVNGFCGTFVKYNYDRRYHRGDVTLMHICKKCETEIVLPKLDVEYSRIKFI